MKTLLRNVRGALVFALLTVNTILWCLPLFVLALLKLIVPIAGFRRVLTKMLMALGQNWIGCNRLILAGSGSLRWQAKGIEGLSRKGWYLVVANHQTWVDIMVLQSVFNRRIPFLKFFIKQELIWFPFLGVAWWALDMPFMKRYSASYLAKHPEKKGKDLKATRKACEKFRDTPTSVISFIEGTRFSEQKRAKKQSPYQHLLPPRAGGVAVALTSMGEVFDALVDVTLVYPDGPPQFWDMCCGDQVRVVIDVRARAIDESMIAGDYQEDREFRRSMHRWLREIWEEKDELIQTLKDDSQLSGGVT